MRHPPVHWYEGMFLRPQHFQAAERSMREFISTSQQWDAHYAHGLRSIEISQEALENSQLQINSCRLRMHDGTVLMFAPGQELERLELKAAFEQRETVRVSLGIPKLRMGRPNVGNVQDGQTVRFVRVATSLQDESQGAHEQEIELRTESARLLMDGDDASGFDVLPLLSIRRIGTADAIPEIDQGYFPPCLALEAWSPLRLLVREIYDIIGRKIEVLRESVLERGITATTPKDLENVLALTAANQAHALLHCLTFAQGVHPFVAYRELCRIVGMLAILRPQRTVAAEEIPAYDHDDLARIFQWARSMIIECLRPGDITPYEQRPFIGTSEGMEVQLDADWVHGWEWYVGVKPVNISDEDCRQLLNPGSGQVDWVIAQREKVDTYFELRMRGLELHELRTVPTDLPSSHGWIYYRVGRESNAWKDVVVKPALGLRVSQEYLFNQDKLPGSKQIELRLDDNKRVILEFSVFAVQKQSHDA